MYSASGFFWGSIVMGAYRIRTVRTASGATAVQVVWYEKDTTQIAKHIGSAKNEDELLFNRNSELRLF